MEIERKFLVARLPESLSAYQKKIIRQGYVSVDPVIRVRQSNDDYILTVKGEGKLARQEFELPLTQEQFHDLWQKTESRTISKDR